MWDANQVVLMRHDVQLQLTFPAADEDRALDKRRPAGNLPSI